MRALVRSTYWLILMGTLAVAGLGGCSSDDVPDARVMSNFPDAHPAAPAIDAVPAVDAGAPDA
jgi:hypothetical protein